MTPLNDAEQFHEVIAAYCGKAGKPSRKLLDFLKDKGLTQRAIEYYSAFVLQKYAGVGAVWFYDEAGILETNADDFLPIMLRDGMLAVGSCANGDPIAVDLREQIGVAGYIDHETMWDAPNVRERFVVLAQSLGQFVQEVRDQKMPMDYYDAMDRQK